MARQQSATTEPTTKKEDGRFKVNFQAEVREVKSRKTASLDIEYRVVLLTSDPTVLNLGALDSDVLLDVDMGVVDG